MANFYDKASLVLIPSGTKEGVCFSQKPTNGDGDFTFSRSTSATRVGPSGYIEKETQNLLLQSNQFDTTWVQFQGASLTSGQSGYDGSNDAWRLNVNNTQAGSGLYQAVSGSDVRTESIYAKAGTLDHLGVVNMSGAGFAAWFDLTNGTIGTQGSSNIDASIESVGNGWYRISLTQLAANGYFQIKPSDGENTPSNSNGYIYIQDAQLEQGLVARDYIETTTSAVYGGITDNIPRLDYTDSSCPSLLLEPQRTNLVTYSEDFSNAAWVKTNVTITPNQGISPDGSNNAFKYFGASANQDLRINVNVSSNYTYSFYVKAINSPYIRLRSTDGSCWFNMTTNEVATNTFASAEIKSVGNDWYRLSVTSSSFTVNNNFYVHPHATDNTTSELSGGEFLLWGAQVEQGSYATSYIPTYGSAVTRNVDVCNNAGNASTFNDSEGVLYAEIAALANDGTDRRLTISDGTFNNNVQIIYTSATNQVKFLGNNSGVTYADFVYTLSDVTEYHKFAFRYKDNDFSFWIDGVQVGTDTSGTAPTGLSQLQFANTLGTSAYFYGKTNQILYFPTALTNEELAALTTI